MTRRDSPAGIEALMSEPLLNRALRTVVEALVITDATQAIVFANAAFTTMTGYDEAELLGRNCRLLQGAGSDPEVLALMRLCLANGEAFRGQILNYDKDGSPFWNALSISPVHDDKGVVTHFISVQRDATAHIAGSDTLHLPPTTRSRAATESVPTTHSYRERVLDGGLRMHMQPVIDLRTGSTYLVEALARLELEDGTLISPGAFLPLLTEQDVALLFRLALDHVLAQLAEWDQTGLRLAASVNLAPSTLRDPDCVRWVADALERHAIEPSRLGLELLETDVLHDGVQLEAFAELGALGVGLAMDDFGARHSSLRRLMRMPFDAVKIDGELVAQLRVRPVPALAILATLIQMGRDNSWDIVVEGLEDAGLTEAATILGAPYGQGFFLSRPMPAQDIPDWLEGADGPPCDGEIRTILGALAYHWMAHRVGAPHTGPHDACPITAILADENDQAAIEWHQQQHLTASAPSESSDRLLAWLTERSRPAPRRGP
jgi:PAS domain S-box-containing protein